MRVKSQAFTRFVAWDHALDPQEMHRAAAEAIVAEWRWEGPWIGGANSAGDGYVFVREVTRD